MLQHKVGITAFCIIVLLVICFLYWHTFYNTDNMLPAHFVQPAPTQPLEKSIEKPHRDVQSAIETPAAPEQKMDPDYKETPDRAGELTKAIDFLETLEEQSPLEKSGNATEQQDSNSTTTLTQDEMLQLVREGISYYDSLLESGSIEFRVESTSVDFPGKPRGPNGTRYGTFEFSDGRFRSTITENMTYYSSDEMNMSSQRNQSTTEFAYDTETFEMLREDNNGFRLQRSTDMTYPTLDDPRFWGWNLSGTTGSLIDVIDSVNVKNIQIDESSGSQNYYITGTAADGSAHLWLNPEKSYRPERVVFQSPTGSLIREFDFQEVAPDLWFPVSASSVITGIDTATGAETAILTQKVTMTNVRLNEHIPSSRFTIEPPPGSQVYDGRTRESFKVPEENN